MDSSAHFKGKKITVLGLGVLGRGVGDARYLAECGAELVVTDLKSREELAESVVQLETFPNITFVLGEHRLEDFRNRDLVLKAAGVPLDSPYVAEAKKHGVPVRMSADLFMELSGVQTVGITGTRGKSTVTYMIAAILEAAGKRVLLGGNVRGVSTLALLKEATPEHVAVLELDSWQCQGLGEAKLSPHIAVFTTFYRDHLNYYRDDMDAYLADKANIFLYQKSGDVLVLGSQARPALEKSYSRYIGRAIEADMHELRGWELKIPGNHNRQNAACAVEATRSLGIDETVIRSALESFQGVPGRLEFVREVRGIKIYNDNNATTPEATIAGVTTLAGIAGNTHQLVLIMGGADKGLDVRGALSEINRAVDRVILLPGTGTERIKDEYIKRKEYASSLEDAVERALKPAKEGDIVLFSPAFASFGMFKNEYDRGDQFVAIVKEL